MWKWSILMFSKILRTQKGVFIKWCIIFFIIYFGTAFILRGYFSKKYYRAVNLYDEGKYLEAKEIFDNLGNYRNSVTYSRELSQQLVYDNAMSYYEDGEYENAIEKFKSLGEFKDSEKWTKESKYKYAKELFNLGKYEEAYRLFQEIADYKDSLSYVVKSTNIIKDTTKDRAYEEAKEYYADGEYENALKTLESLEGYKDSDILIKQWGGELPEYYDKAQEYLSEGKYYIAQKTFESLGDYLDSREMYTKCVKIRTMKLSTTISAGLHYSVALKNDGEIKCTYNAYDFSDWNDIISVAGFGTMIIGLKEDGTVIIQGRKDMDDHNPEGLQDVRRAPKVDGLKDVVQVVAGQQHVAALKADGTVVADGLTALGQTKTEEWKDIVSIAAGWMHTVGVDSSGHVWFTGRDQNGQAETIKSWSDIVAVSAGGGVDGYPGNGHTVGLKRDGTVVAAGENKYGQCDVTGEGWTDIVAISAGDWHTVGLRKDGTVISTRPSQEVAEAEKIYTAACNVEDWTDIVAISAGCGITLGLKKDGSIVSTGYGDHDQRPKDGDPEWKNIRINKEWGIFDNELGE